MQDGGTKPPATVNVSVYTAIKQSIPISNKRRSGWREANETGEWSATLELVENGLFLCEM